MKVFEKKQKDIPGWGYWGDPGEIDMAFSYGSVATKDAFSGDKLHYHKRGTIYIICIQGSGTVEVDGKEVLIKKDQLLQIDPGERYRHTGVVDTPFLWITVCTVKDLADKVVVA